MPKRFHGPPALPVKQAKNAAKGKVVPARSKRPASTAAPAVEPLRAGAAWWAVPIGLLSLILIAPITIMLVVWYRNRRAEREYAHSARER